MKQNLIIGLILGRFGSLAFMNFLKLQLCAGPNVNMVGCTDRNNSQRKLYVMTLPSRRSVHVFVIWKVKGEELSITYV